MIPNFLSVDVTPNFDLYQGDDIATLIFNM